MNNKNDYPRSGSGAGVKLYASKAKIIFSVVKHKSNICFCCFDREQMNPLTMLQPGPSGQAKM
jgi:hypothetical protein